MIILFYSYQEFHQLSYTAVKCGLPALLLIKVPEQIKAHLEALLVGLMESLIPAFPVHFCCLFVWECQLAESPWITRLIDFSVWLLAFVLHFFTDFPLSSVLN